MTIAGFPSSICTTNNEIFLVTNEEGIDTTLKTLQASPLRGNTIIGVSGLFTLNLVSARQTPSDEFKSIDYLMMLDCSTKVQNFWDTVKPLFIESTDRQDFIKRFKKICCEDRKDFMWIFHPNQASLEQKFETVVKSNNWLLSDRCYNLVSHIFQQKRFVFILLNLTDYETVYEFKKVLEINNLYVDTLYVSNVLHYLPPQQIENFGKSIHHLTNPTTWLIDVEDPPFQITPLFSIRCSNLNLAVNYPSEFLGEDPVMPIQRTREFQNMVESFPLVALAQLYRRKQMHLGKLFFEYGLHNNYYTLESALKIQNLIFSLNFSLNSTSPLMMRIQYHSFKFFINKKI